MKIKSKRKLGTLDPVILADIVKRVVRTAKPEKIVLFGSAARGTMGPNSDVDLLVVKEGKFNRWSLLTNIYRELRDTDIGVDVVVATPEEIRAATETATA